MNQICGYHAYGDETALIWRSASMPRPGPHQLIVKLSAASINPVDWKILAGQQAFFTGRHLSKPRIFGSDFAGNVYEVGDRHRAARLGLRPGTPVMGMVNPLRTGSFQKYLCLGLQDCVPLDAEVDILQAAGAGAVGISAWRSVRSRKTGFWKDKIVVLNGAAGGVGSITLQLLAQGGARVIALASPAKHGLLQSLGAYQCLDYHDTIKVLASAPWDGLIDCHGAFLHQSISKLVKRGGRYIPVAIPNADIVSTIAKFIPNLLLYGISSQIVLAKPSQAILKELASALAAHTLIVPVERVFSYEQVHAAVRLSREGHATGKIIITF